MRKNSWNSSTFVENVQVCVFELIFELKTLRKKTKKCWANMQLGNLILAALHSEWDFCLTNSQFLTSLAKSKPPNNLELHRPPSTPSTPPGSEAFTNKDVMNPSNSWIQSSSMIPWWLARLMFECWHIHWKVTCWFPLKVTYPQVSHFLGSAHLLTTRW